jgi:D-amino-acid oxidase
MAYPTKIDVIVLGAGVSGLTTAICLAEGGYPVRVIADRSPEHTTSAVAGANWGPYLSNDGRIMRWSTVTRLELERISRTVDGCGVRLVTGLEAAPTVIPAPAWVLDLPDYRPATVHDLPKGFESGYWYTGPVVDMPRYLAYLQQRLAQSGVTVRHGRIESLAELAGAAPVVVNCTGLGARELVGDTELTPTRGQLVMVAHPPERIDWFFQDTAEFGDMTYFLPHSDYVVLGGSAVRGRDDQDVDKGIAEAIIERCGLVEPRLRDPAVLGHRVGLRPSRPRVRLEWDDSAPAGDASRVLHNYGHGGSGMTLSWGCARDVVGLVAGE